MTSFAKQSERHLFWEFLFIDVALLFGSDNHISFKVT